MYNSRTRAGDSRTYVAVLFLVFFLFLVSAAHARVRSGELDMILSALFRHEEAVDFFLVHVPLHHFSTP